MRALRGTPALRRTATSLLVAAALAGGAAATSVPAAAASHRVAPFIAGQLAIVAALLPMACAVRGTRFYARTGVGGGSLAVAALAGVWFAERALDIGLLPAIEARS